jgi:hypothetical protein
LDEYFVIFEVTGNESGYEVGILSNKPAPAGDESWDEVFERYSTSDAQSAGTERVSPDAMEWQQRRNAIGSYKSAMRQGQGWLDYHTGQAESSLAGVKSAFHQVSALRAAMWLRQLGEGAATLVAEKPGLARTHGERSKQVEKNAKSVATDVIKLQLTALKPWGVDTQVTSSKAGGLPARTGDLYISWLNRIDSQVEAKVKSCRYTGPGLTEGDTPFARAMPREGSSGEAKLDPSLVQDLKEWMLLTKEEHSQQHVKTPSNAPTKPKAKVVLPLRPSGSIASGSARFRSTVQGKARDDNTAVTHPSMPSQASKPKKTDTQVTDAQVSRTEPSLAPLDWNKERQCWETDAAMTKRLEGEMTRPNTSSDRRWQIATHFGLDPCQF